MRRDVRAGWLAVGGALTSFVVVGVALWAWSEITKPAAWVSTSMHVDKEPTTAYYSYQLRGQKITVHAIGQVRITVTTGTEPELAVQRDVNWTLGRLDLNEDWDGSNLMVNLNCPQATRLGTGECSAAYTLTVPPGIPVEVTGPDGRMRCKAVPSESPGNVCTVSVGQ